MWVLFLQLSVPHAQKTWYTLQCTGLMPALIEKIHNVEWQVGQLGPRYKRRNTLGNNSRNQLIKKLRHSIPCEEKI